MDALLADPQEGRDSAQEKKGPLTSSSGEGPWESSQKGLGSYICVLTRASPPCLDFSVASTTGRNMNPRGWPSAFLIPILDGKIHRFGAATFGEVLGTLQRLSLRDVASNSATRVSIAESAAAEAK